MVHESKLYTRNCFVTFTYSDAELPDRDSLEVRDWQNFAKRLRHHLCDCTKPPCKVKAHKFRFFMCGEYSDDERPHYHAAIFSINFSKDRKHYRNTKEGHPIWTSQTLDDLWTHGQCFIGNLSHQSAAYVARYIMKKQTGPQAKLRYGETIKLDQGECGTQHASLQLARKPEFTTMSRSPGIGHDWLMKFHTDVYPADEVISQGKSCPPPKYYDTQLEKHHPELWKTVKAARITNAKQREENNTWERLRVRETVSIARTKQLKRG